MDHRRIIVEDVWKKYRRGQRHDSLRDLIPYSAQRLFRRTKADELGKQEFWVVQQLSFDVKAGETVGIIGVNGAGKSTTLKLLTRILRPTRGRLQVLGRVGALIELAAGFHPDLTGRENVFLQGAVMGLRRAEVAKKFDEIVEFSGVSEFIDTQVKRYSSGMNARLGFSIAAFLDPEVLLIDEVLAVGDLSFQQKCFARLEDFRREGIAIAFVSHNMQAIARLCDRVILLTPGGPPRTGSVEQMLRAYVSGQGHSQDSRIAEVQSHLRVVTDSGAEVAESVKPGDFLNLRLSLRPRLDLPRCGLGIRVHRADGLMVFDAGSMVEGEPPLHVSAGSTYVVEVIFQANLGQGLYTIQAHLSHAERHWPMIDLGPVARFAVDSPKRVGAIAELHPRFCASVHDAVAARE
jgi:lipopolysaccharide transport system ATP-binding protein